MKLARRGACVALAGVALSLACGGTRTRTQTQETKSTPLPAAMASALVRVVHTVPEGKPLDVFAGDHTAFAGVKYKTVTEYHPLAAERMQLRVSLAGEDAATPLLENSVAFAADRHYTLVIMSGNDGKPLQLQILNDDLDPPTQGKLRIRVVNATSEVSRLQVVLGGRTQPLASGLEARGVREYEEIEPLHGTLELRDEALKRTLAKLPDWHLDAGKSYTLYVLGRTTGTPGVEPLVIQDDLRSAVGG